MARCPLPKTLLSLPKYPIPAIGPAIDLQVRPVQPYMSPPPVATTFCCKVAPLISAILFGHYLLVLLLLLNQWLFPTKATLNVLIGLID